MIQNIFVTAGAGREVPIPTTEATAPGGELLRCKPGKVYRLPNTTYTRKRLNTGDLLLVDRNGVLVGSMEAASAPDVLELDHTGAVEQLIAAVVAPTPNIAVPSASIVTAAIDTHPALTAFDHSDATKGT